MVLVDALRHVYEIVVAVKRSALDVSVAPFARCEECHGPTVFHQSGRHFKSVVVHTVVAHSVPYRSALLDVDGACGDVYRTSDRGGGDDSCTETALCLDVGRNFAESGPV